MAEAVLLICLTVINLVLWVVFIFRFKKTFSPDVLLTDVKNEFNKLLTEINRTVYEDITLLESRRDSLRELLQIADKRLTLLQKEEGSRLREEKLLKKLSVQKKTYSALNNSEAKKEKMPKTVQYSYEQADNSAADNTQYTPPVSGSDVQLSIDFESYRTQEEPEIVNDSPGAAEKEIPLRDQVLALYEQGVSADLISRKTRLPVSAVQFIIDTFGE